MGNWERGENEDWSSYRERLEREVRSSVRGRHYQPVKDKANKIMDRWLDDIQKPIEKGDDKKLERLRERQDKDLARLYRNALKDKEFREGLPWGCRKLIGGIIVTIFLACYLILSLLP